MFSWDPGHFSLRQQLKKAHTQAENFRSDFARLSNERRAEQNELERLIDELRGQLQVDRKETCNQGQQTTMQYPTLMHSSQSTFDHLQTCTTQLLDANADQEKVIHQTRARLELSENRVSGLTNAFDRLSGMINEMASGRSFADLEDPVQLVENVGSTIRALKSTNEVLVRKIEGLEKQLRASEDRRKSTMELVHREHTEQLLEQRDSVHNEMLRTVKKAEASTLETGSLSSEATKLKDPFVGELDRKSEEIKRLHQKLELQLDRQDKLPRQPLQNALDKAEQAAVRLRCERDSAVSQQSVLSAKLEAAETYMKELEFRCSEQLMMQERLKRKLNEARQQKARLLREVASCVTVFGNVQELLVQRLQLPKNELPLRPPVPFTKASEISMVTEQLLYLATQLKLKQSDEENRNRVYEEQEQQITPKKANLEEQTTQSGDHQKLLDEQKADIDRITLERDYYIDLLNEQTEELLSIKADYQRQLRETAKLARTKDRLDELTQQIQLLTCSPTNVKVIHSCCTEVPKTTNFTRERSASCCIRTTNHQLDSSEQGLHSQTTSIPDDRHSSSTALNQTKESVSQQFIEKFRSPAAETMATRMASFSNKLKGLRTACHYLEVAQRDLKKAQNSVPNWSTDRVPQTAGRFGQNTGDSPSRTQSQGRLNAVDVQRFGAANENVGRQNMSNLLLRMTERNRKLIKELEDQTTSYTTNMTASKDDPQTLNSVPIVPSSEPDSTQQTRLPHQYTSSSLQAEESAKSSAIRPNPLLSNGNENRGNDIVADLQEAFPGVDRLESSKMKRPTDDMTDLGLSTTVSMPWSHSQKLGETSTDTNSINKAYNSVRSEKVYSENKNRITTILEHPVGQTTSVPNLQKPTGERSHGVDEITLAKINEYRSRLYFDCPTIRTSTHSNSVLSLAPLDVTRDPLSASPIVKPWRSKINLNRLHESPTATPVVDGSATPTNLLGLSGSPTDIVLRPPSETPSG
ncbi:paramyosin [Clonorchis sinensis]|uniref:Paramyosin n=1 Tax=Clonorchis sinensis TaxID=79923 RepID=G7YKY5_CLOSI|nr:paramyosin [Clonorchis sinensis]